VIIAKTDTIKSHLMKAGYTGAGLARDIEISQGYVCQILNGKVAVLAPTAKKIYSALGCAFDEIFEIRERVNKQ